MRSVTVPSPVGPLLLAAAGEHLRRVTFVGEWPAPEVGEPGTEPTTVTTATTVTTTGEAAATGEAVREPGAPPARPPTPGSREEAVLTEAAHQLAEYFAGTRERFELPLGPRGSEFQRAVWRELTRIPYGTTASYGAVAARLGLPPGSARAVGVAASQNPLVVVVPCHRMIGADGTLVGFGGGIARKERLLALEGTSLF